MIYRTMFSNMDDMEHVVIDNKHDVQHLEYVPISVDGRDQHMEILLNDL